MSPKKSKQVKLYEETKGVESSILRSLAGLIPYIGTAIGELLTSSWTKIREKRLEEAFSRIASKINKIEKEKIDQQYVKSEEFQHLLITCLNQISNEYNKEKRHYFINVLVNSLKVDKNAEERALAEWFTGILQRVSDYHFIIFKLLSYSPSRRQKAFREMIKDKIARQAIFSCIRDLEGAGFITNVMYKENTLGRKVIDWSSIRLSPTGEKLVEWISDNPNE